MWLEWGLKTYTVSVLDVCDLYFSTKVILLLFIVRKAESWLRDSMKLEQSDNTQRQSYLLSMYTFISYF